MCINTLTNDKDEVRLAEKLIKVYKEHTATRSQMTLANKGTEVKQFWRYIKETQDLIYGGTKMGGNNNPQGQGHGNKNKRSRRKDKKKAANTELVAAVAEKDIYCFNCGEASHTVKECTVQGDLKCDIHPNLKSHAKLACYIYRKANNMPVRNRSHPEGPKDTDTNTAPPPGNGANLVMAAVDDEVDTTDIYTDYESDKETNAVELSDIVKDVDEQDYRTESGRDSEDDTQMPPGYIPPTPPRPRGEDGV